ncbi:MAG: glycosyltransferase, partial [bacterium]
MTRRANDPGALVMFVMNDMLNDPRVHREARAAVRAGFRVTVVAMQTDQCRFERGIVDGYEIIRVRSPQRFLLMSLCLRVWSIVLLLKPILKDGLRLALDLPPGPQAPGQEPGVPSRLRRIKWGLMRTIGSLLLPLRLFRPFLDRLSRWLEKSRDTEGAGVVFSGKLSRYVGEISFIRSTFWISWAMLRAVRSERAQVFHGHDLPTLPVTTWAARRAGGKALYDSHELWVGMSPDWSSFFNRVARWVEDRYIRKMDGVVTVNDLIAGELQRRYQVSLPTVVMNCPEPESPRALDPRHSIRAGLELPRHEPLILYQGRYAPWRGLEALIESSRYLSRGILVLRGYGSNEEDLRRRVAALGDGRRACMVDPVPMADLVSAASEADIGVVPYTPCTLCNYYASPNKLFEYMMAGLA